ncbi:hypothetical protein NVP1118B_43 [Vibrio phage 1.118.B._10N.261.49.F6]|nr:hypothetical protein NVP1022O_43 [Vibrio phage 1.022.O._10N.286.45.A10]AUR88803.1 hypothetical protein NVP1118A_43 [Vibrio phage 1.118.A._10N.261.49.F6]AUR88899.1 hypothetical protein NVP1118B_43 [Vibrio phage 1.118.B._10N.261.49.F6]AUR94507.1 hypothetical protein NVP1195O_42 [Vibrio phage 1.195.O._10N.286.54.C8]AUR97100.1 hypothetical protein NVP1237A_41 [Vibrio phage 1.237.A._10N.261.52.C5]AUR97195.1 hypothetical protein NVP1237B_41 [Vibrio phage 1.237.B._10N.261.52.C5]AUR99805.1 hypothe
MTPITNTVLREIQIGRTVLEITQYHDLTARQVRGAIKNLDLTYHIDRIPVGNVVVYKVNRRRVRPMKAGIKRH